MMENIQTLDVVTLETSSRNPKYLIANGSQHWEVSPAIAYLVMAFQQNEGLKEVASWFSERCKKEYSEEEVSRLAELYIRPILNDESEVGASKPFLLRVNLLSAEQVAFFSKHLKLLFGKPVIVSLFVLIMALEVLFFTVQDLTLKTGELSVLVMIGVCGLYVCSSFFHELGHASACRHFGVKHGGVGFGLYLNFPVFYTDVTQVWRLTRKQRMVVNVAGAYFQLLFLLPLILLSLVYDWPVLRYFVIVINLNFLMTLNPFFKFDGYWILTDLIGVPNLRQRTNELITYYVRKLQGKPIEKRPFLLDIKPVEKIVAGVYTVVVNVFFAFYFCYFLPNFLISFFMDFPGLFKQVLDSVAVGHLPNFATLRVLFGQLAVFALSAFFIYMMGKSWWKRIRTGLKNRKK